MKKRRVENVVFAKRRLSLEKALCGLLGKGRFRKLLALSPDRRELIERSSVLLQITEKQLLELLGRKLKLPVLENVRPLPPEKLEDIAQLQLFEDLGMIPIYSLESPTGLACVDPMRARPYLQLHSDALVYLAPWSTIRRALRDSRELVLSHQSDLSAQAPDDQLELVRAVIGLLIERCEEHGASSCSVSFSTDEEPVFEFLDRQGARGSGCLGAEIRDALFQLLLCSCEGELKINEDDPEKKQYVVIGSFDKPADTFEIVWRVLKPIVAERNESEDSEAPVESIGRILLIEDNPTFARVLEDFLERKGMSCDHVPSGEQALEKLKQASFDCILCDVHLPGLSSLELVESIRHMLVPELPPIVILTSDESVDTELKFYSAGVDAFLRKSDDPRLVSSQIFRLIQHEERRRAA